MKTDHVRHKKVTFINRFEIEPATNLYESKEMEGKLTAIVFSGAFQSRRRTVFEALRTNIGGKRKEKKLFLIAREESIEIKKKQSEDALTKKETRTTMLLAI